MSIKSMDAFKFLYVIEALYKEPFGYIERVRIEEQENYSPLLP